MSTSYAVPKLMPLRAYSAHDPILYPDFGWATYGR